MTKEKIKYILKIVLNDVIKKGIDRLKIIVYTGIIPKGKDTKLSQYQRIYCFYNLVAILDYNIQYVYHTVAHLQLHTK